MRDSAWLDKFEVRLKQVFPATLVDKDNQPLATGRAILESLERGSFQPDQPIPQDKSTKAKGLVPLGAWTSIPITALSKCVIEGHNHHSFLVDQKDS